MIHQLYHVGQHGDADNSFAPNWSPSGLPSYHDADGSHAVTEAEIEQLLDGFVRAASRARASGFDGVELFAAYHALIDQFWTPWSNRRTDRWGGSLENRVRFSRTLLERIRTACGDDFIVGLAVNADPASPASLRFEELQEIVAWHDSRALMDYVTCGTGSYFDFFKLMPTSLYPARLGEPLRRRPEGRHGARPGPGGEPHPDGPRRPRRCWPPATPTWSRSSGARSPIPTWWPRPATGRADEVRPCISCNQLCWGRRSRDYWISCLVNPSTGREWEWGGDRFEAGRRRRGRSWWSAAARPDWKRRGWRPSAVTTSPWREADQELGGQWRLAGRQPSRSQVLDHLAWYGRQLDRLDVEVRLGQSVDGEAVRASGADEVVVATGAAPARAGFQRALPLVDRLPGVDGSTAASIEDVLAGAVAPSGTRAAARRPRRLAGHRNGDVPAGGRMPGDARDLGAGRRPPGCSTARPTARPGAASPGPAARRFRTTVVLSWDPTGTVLIARR